MYFTENLNINNFSREDYLGRPEIALSLRFICFFLLLSFVYDQDSGGSAVGVSLILWIVFGQKPRFAPRKAAFPLAFT